MLSRLVQLFRHLSRSIWNIFAAGHCAQVIDHQAAEQGEADINGQAGITDQVFEDRLIPDKFAIHRDEAQYILTHVSHARKVFHLAFGQLGGTEHRACDNLARVAD